MLLLRVTCPMRRVDIGTVNAVEQEAAVAVNTLTDDGNAKAVTAAKTAATAAIWMFMVYGFVHS